MSKEYDCFSYESLNPDLKEAESKGQAEGMRDIVAAMKLDNMELDDISKLTGLSIKDIENM